MKPLWPALLSALVAIPAASFAQAPDDVSNYLIYKDQAYFVGAPLLVAGPKVANPSWSLTGQYLAYEQEQGDDNVPSLQDSVRKQKTPEREDSLSIYSLSVGKSAEVMRFDGNLPHREDIYWLANTDKALMVVQSTTLGSDGEPSVGQKLYFLDAASASMREFSPWDTVDKPYMYVVSTSPTQPYAFVTAEISHESLDKDGKKKSTLSREVVLVNVDERFGIVHTPDDNPGLIGMWSPDGTRAYITAREGAKATWYSVSLLDASTTPTTRPPAFYMGGQQGTLLSVREIGQITTNGKETRSINSLWLESPDPDNQNRLLLAGGATDGQVNKTMDCVSFTSQGALFIRPITLVPKARYEEAKVLYNRSQALNQARQAGFAALMYAADHEDTLPGMRDNLADLLGPYLNDAGTLDGFIYTFPGGPAKDIQKPASTQLGYVPYADGRAVVYADGHSQWVPNP